MSSSDGHSSDKGVEVESPDSPTTGNLATVHNVYPTPRASKKRSRDIFDTMKDLGSLGATSLQRVYPYPTIDLDQCNLSDLTLKAKRLIGRRDLSGIPLDGNLTDDLFLALRNKDQLELLKRRKRRRALDLMGAFLPENLQEELQELHNADDAESETSETEVEGIKLIGDDGIETEIDLKLNAPGEVLSEGSLCSEDCILKGWENVDFGSKVPIESHDVEIVEKSSIPLYSRLPAKHIRVLELQPGVGGGIITCKLHLQNLDEVPIVGRHVGGDHRNLRLPKYETLSYHWGSPTLSDIIICNGTPTKITHNLYSALRHLRETEHSRFLWVDALCIDQTNNLERNDQVRLMLKIYKSAFRVVVWLGESTDDEGERAILFLKVIDHPTQRWAVLHASHESRCIRTLEIGYKAVCKLYQRTWFQRTWIRQELTAGRKVVVQCGRQMISWAALKRGSTRLSGIRKRLQKLNISDIPAATSPSTIEYLTHGWVYGQTVSKIVSVAGSLYYWHGGGLLDLLVTGAQFDVTDPRDRIYAVLGLAREPVAEGDNEDAIFPFLGPGETFEPMIVDYNSTVSEVYQRLAKTIINRDANLDILCLLDGLRNEASGDLPSWTPDWRVKCDALSDYHTLKFFASGYTRAEKQDQADLGKLRVKAYAVDQVKSVLDITATTWDLLYENGEALIKSEGSLENRKEWQGLSVFAPIRSRSNCRCCVTYGEHVALVPLSAEAGDFIYIVLGARLPFILRDTSTKKEFGAALEKLNLNSNSYLLGPCCLPGFMQGEVFSTVGDKEPQSLTLI